MAQSLCSVKNVYDVPSKVFVPQPKVKQPNRREQMVVILINLRKLQVNAAVMQLKPELKFPEDENLASMYSWCYLERADVLNNCTQQNQGTFLMLEDVVRYFFNKRRKSMSHMLKWVKPVSKMHLYSLKRYLHVDVSTKRIPPLNSSRTNSRAF